MKKYAKYLMVYGILFSIHNVFGISYRNNNRGNNEDQKLQQESDVIIFYSNDSVFSPVVVLQENAEILWTWDDNSTTNSATPTKNYGSNKLRKNTLKVIPWSAVRRINIGYDAQDGGSPEIEHVDNQYVSKIENLNLVAPYLKEWCSSYNRITSLDFSNFINLETIECFLSQSLQNVNLDNTPKLKRVCFVINSLLNLDMSDCISLEEILIGSNKFTNITLPQQAENIWYFGARENPQLTNQYLYNDLSNYPNISHLSIWNSNQKGDLVIPKTNPTMWVGIRAYDNQYSSLDLRGSFQNDNSVGLVDFHNNKLTKVELAGCLQISTLDLSHNLLTSESVDYVLKQLDEFSSSISERIVDLSNNQPITAQGKVYKSNLEAKGWNVFVDSPTTFQSLNESESFNVYPNPSNGKFQIHLDKMPYDGVIVEHRNVVGQKLHEQKINDFNTELSVNQYPGKIFFVTLIGTNIHNTKRIFIK